jgi:hypothetical protein
MLPLAVKLVYLSATMLTTQRTVAADGGRWLAANLVPVVFRLLCIGALQVGL